MSWRRGLLNSGVGDASIGCQQKNDAKQKTKPGKNPKTKGGQFGVSKTKDPCLLYSERLRDDGLVHLRRTRSDKNRLFGKFTGSGAGILGKEKEEILKAQK